MNGNQLAKDREGITGEKESFFCETKNSPPNRLNDPNFERRLVAPLSLLPPMDSSEVFSSTIVDIEGMGISKQVSRAGRIRFLEDTLLRGIFRRWIMRCK